MRSVKVLARVCSSCDLAGLDVDEVVIDDKLIERVHCRLCDGRRCRTCRTPASAAAEAFAICHYCADPIPPLGSAA